MSSLLDMENLQIEDVEREMETEKQIAEVESKEAEQQEQEEVLQDYGMLPDADGKSQSVLFMLPLSFSTCNKVLHVVREQMFITVICVC